jgi:hypothetical protein
MKSCGWVLSAALALFLLALPVRAESEPVVKAWGNTIVVTAPDEGSTPADLAVRRTLADREVTFNLKDAPFSEAVDFLAVAGSVNIVIHPKAGVEHAAVTLALKKVSVQTALEFLTRQVELSWTVRDGVVRIGHTEDLVGPMRTSTYDVTDLLAVAPDFKGPDLPIQFGNTQTGNQPPLPWPPNQPTVKTAPPEKARAELMQELVDIVSGMLKTGTWDQTVFP